MAVNTKTCVLVTGGAQRLGRAIALHFARHGYDLAIHYRTSEDEARSVCGEIEGMGRAARHYRADLSDLGACADVVSQVAADFPNLTGLVNSASVFERDDIATMTPEFYAAQMRVNAEAPLFLTQALWKAVDRRGWALNLIDSKIDQLTPAFFSYTLSKLALANATRMLAMACAPKLRVNAIAPGLVLRSGNQTDAEFERVHGKTPLERGPTPDDIAQMALALAEAPTTTGQTVTVDGGLHFYSPKSAGKT